MSNYHKGRMCIGIRPDFIDTGDGQEFARTLTLRGASGDATALEMVKRWNHFEDHRMNAERYATLRVGEPGERVTFDNRVEHRALMEAYMAGAASYSSSGSSHGG